MRHSDRRRRWLWLTGALVAAALAFALWPGMDLRVAGWFWRPGQGFWIEALPGVEAARNVVWDLTILAFVVALAGAGLGWAGRPLLGVPPRDWLYLALLYLAGPILLVNGILKAHWGRARPADVAEFGGAHLFTPPWLPADQCLSNCSFVSGEVAATVVMGIAMLVVAPALRPCLRGAGIRLWVWAACLLPVAVAAQRVVTGRHFLSDTVFAALFMLVLAQALAPLRDTAGGGAGREAE